MIPIFPDIPSLCGRGYQGGVQVVHLFALISPLSRQGRRGFFSMEFSHAPTRPHGPYVRLPEKESRDPAPKETD